MVLPVLALVTLALAWLVALGVAQARVVDAARETARLVARDVPEDEARAAGARVAPEGAAIDVLREGDLVRVTVEAPVTGPDLLGGVLGGTLSATAVASAEDVG